MTINEYLPVIIPLILLQTGLTIFTLIHVIRHNKYRIGNQTIWIVASFFAFIGPILYFCIGRNDEGADD